MPRGGSWQSSPLLIILLPIITLTLLFLTVPPFLSATSHILRPTSVVKNSWDSLNILLVVFAILAGVFAPRNDDESPQQPHQEATTTNDAVPRNNVTYHTTSSGEQEAGSYVSQQWFGFSEERKVYDAPPIRYQSPATGVTRLRRSSSSYPDLRNWETGDDRYKFRFFDDFEIDKFRSTPPRDQAPAVVDRPKRSPETEEFEEDRVKEIPVDTFEISSSSSSTLQPPPPKSPAPPPPPPPPTPPPRRKPRRTHQIMDSGSEITEHDEDNELTRIRTPPPPSPSVKARSEHKRRKSNVKREIAMVWASVLSNQRKRKKKQRTKSDHNHDHDHHYDNFDELTSSTTAPPTPPPPPPPPPPSVFHSLFRKGSSKSKKIHSVSTPPPPPPPPPLTSSRRWSKRNSQIPPPPPPPEPLRRRNTGRPPLPNKVSNYNDETINNAGNQSPMIPVPPPPPPFKMPAMRFVVRGDFVKIRSNHSSLCSSPEREDIDVSSTVEESEATTVAAATNATVTVMDNGELDGPVFCPSPDVNIKAATFIAKLRGKWKLEKINSMKEKGNGNGPLLHE